MDLEPLVSRAREGDVKAFVELTRRYQHLAFGSALALIHDLQRAADVVQEAFLGAAEARGTGSLSGLAARHRAARGLSGIAAAPS